MSAGAEQKEEQVSHQQETLVDQESFDLLKLSNFRLCFEDHQEQNCHRHLSKKVLAKLPRTEGLLSFVHLLLLLLEQEPLLLVIIEVIGSDEIADIVAIGGGGPRQAERMVDTVSEQGCLLLLLSLILLMEQLAEDASMAGVLFSHPLRCLLVIYQVLLVGLSFDLI